jgi:arylsulfatase A-like enzyme
MASVRHLLHWTILILLVHAGHSPAPASGLAASRPNVVLIMTDNQSPWSLGCYGNPEIRTQHIDQLAAQGVRFTRCFSSNAVCSPTRATWLTGLMPSQHGVHCYLGAKGAQTGPTAYNTIGEFRTLPKVLSESGYACGLVGKWHLGDNLHPQEGFRYWVTMPHGHTTTFYDAEVIENGQVRSEPGYLTDFWTEHALRFLQETKDRPFFLFLAFNGPYGLSPTHAEPAQNRFAALYADQPMLSFPREPVHSWLRAMRTYVNNPIPMRRYAAEISAVDDGVGRVMEALRQRGLDQNTVVIFTADQGLCGGHHGMWGMADHSHPMHTYDETCHVPLIFRHPPQIPAGRSCDLMVSNYDFYSTLLQYLGLADRIPEFPKSPGRDYSSVLRGRQMDWENVIYYEFEASRMIRTADWKYTRRFPAGPDELYDLKHDPGEKTNLAGNPEFAPKQKELAGRLTAFFDRYADPQYDLWQGGRSKARPVNLQRATQTEQPVKESRRN